MDGGVLDAALLAVVTAIKNGMCVGWWRDHYNKLNILIHFCSEDTRCVC